MNAWMRIVAALGVLSIVPAAEAGRIEFPFGKVQSISDGAGAERILLDPGDLSVLRDELILSAFLEFTRW